MLHMVYQKCFSLTILSDNKSEDVEAILLYSVLEILVQLDLVWPHMRLLSYLLT